MPPADKKNDLISRYWALMDRLRTVERRLDRPQNSVNLIAVSKTYPAADIRVIANEGQRDFGENQLQDAMGKILALRDLSCIWHFIGPIQSNKCRDIAHHFDWAHSVDRLKVARRLSELRPASTAPLNILLQVNLQNETTKSGVDPNEITDLANAITKLPNIRLRGLMTIPSPEKNFKRQRTVFASLRALKEVINRELETNMGCLSMGMTDDLEAAVAEGATHVRVGTAIFGPRKRRQTYEI
jgi:PLP dependent protein